MTSQIHHGFIALTDVETIIYAAKGRWLQEKLWRNWWMFSGMMTTEDFR